MESFGGKLKALRTLNKLSQEKVVNELNKRYGLSLNKGMFSKWENNKVEPRIDVIRSISSYFNVSLDYLIGIDKNSDMKIDGNVRSNYTYIPTAISAGIPLEIDALVESDLKEIEIPDNLMGKWAGMKGIYITKISGESMNNVIPDGSVIAVKKTSIDCLKDGDIVVFSDEYEYSVKRFFKRNDNLIFRPDSTDKEFYDHVTNNKNEDLIIYGKVVLYLVELN